MGFRSSRNASHRHTASISLLKPIVGQAKMIFKSVHFKLCDMELNPGMACFHTKPRQTSMSGYTVSKSLCYIALSNKTRCTRAKQYSCDAHAEKWFTAQLFGTFKDLHLWIYEKPSKTYRSHYHRFTCKGQPTTSFLL